MKRILFVRDHLHHSNSEMLAGIRRYAKSVNWRIIGRRIPRSDYRTVHNLVTTSKADGVIIEATTYWENALPFQLPTIPTAFINGPRSFSNARSLVITHDSAGTGRRAADALIRLGLRHFLYAPYSESGSCDWSDARERGFSERLAADGFAYERYHPSAEFLQSVVSRHHEIGILAANDEIAAGVFALARTAGIAIPRQLVLLGVDDLPISKKLNLSSIRVDFEMGGFLAAKTLDALIAGNSQQHALHYGDIGIMHRKSTRHISMSSPILSKAIRIIREEACSGLSASRVAAIFPGSRRNAERYFKEATGLSIHEEIEKIRHERTMTLLADTSTPLTALHRLVGYGTPQALRKAFRRQMGQSLLAYRKAIRKATAD